VGLEGARRHPYSVQTLVDTAQLDLARHRTRLARGLLSAALTRDPANPDLAIAVRRARQLAR